MSSGINQIIRTLLDPQNPIYLSFIVVLLIFAIIYLVYRYGVNPAYELFQKEKENLELKAAKMMAQFAELDPDPVIRIDTTGMILETNNAARKLLGDEKTMERNISQFLPELRLTENESILTGTRNLTKKIGNSHYSILYRGDANLQIAHLYFRDITESKQYEEKLINYQSQLKKLSGGLHELIEKERRIIANGLHDGVGQSLSLLRIKIIRMKETTTDAAQISYFQDLVESLEEIINELKDISYSLKPKTLEEMGLQIALKNMIDKVQAETDICGQLNMVTEDIRFDEKTEINIYRIVQEAINNLVKYSKASNFSVQLVNSNKYIRLIVTDNGIGFNPEKTLIDNDKKSGMGLLNIKERVESLKGNFKIDSFPGNGTMLVAEIPIKEKSLWQQNSQYAS